MKYTRYDLRRNKRNNKTLIFILSIIVLIALIIGSSISKFIASRQSKMSIQLDTKINNFDKKGNARFVFIKSNDIKSKDRYQKVTSSLIKFGNIFEIDENSTKYVVLGIFNESEANKISQEIKKLGINNEQQIYKFKGNNLCNIQIAGILNANIQVLNKLSEKDVQAVKLQDLKKWVKSLENVDNRSKNLKVLTNLKSYIDKLPSELKKDNSQKLMKFMYYELAKIK